MRIGDWSSDVCSSDLGRSTAFSRQGVDLFTPIAEGPRDPARAAGGGCFPLVPWSNRIRDGRLQADGRALALTATETGTANALHGHGRRRPWAVIGDGGRSSLRMRYDFPAGAEGWHLASTADQG